jgi:broad specificity phosphatase PhoE
MDKIRLTCTEHGETHFIGRELIQGWIIPDLTELGRKQMQEFASSIIDTPQAIFYSDLNHCKQTVSILIDRFPNTPAFIDWRLRERSFGLLEDVRDNTIDWRIFDEIPPDKSYFGIEPKNHVRERVKAFMRDLAFTGITNAVVISHGGVLNQFKQVLGLDNIRINQSNSASFDIEYSFDNPELKAGDIPKWRTNV